MPEQPLTQPPHIVRADADDAGRILPVIQAAFPRWPAMEIEVPVAEYARWKMEGPPGGPLHSNTLVVVGTEVVAGELRWLAWAQIGDEVIPFDRGTDLAVLPDHQGRGLARLIFDDDIVRNPPLAPFIRWDTPSNHEKVLHLDVGDQVLRSMRVWARAFTPRSFLGLHRAAGVGHLARSAIAGLLRRAPHPARSVAVPHRAAHAIRRTDRRAVGARAERLRDRARA